jgi:hypothetical protein
MSRGLVAVALLVAVAGCKREERGPAPAPLPVERSAAPAVDETEPNNDSKSAQVLKGSAAVHASLADGEKPDEDWFKVELPDSQNLSIEASSLTGAAMEVTVYDSERNKLLKAGSDAPIVPAVMCQKSCYIHVAAAKKGVTGDYTLLVKAAPPTPRNEREPNNRYVDAQEISLGGAIDAFVFPADDQDWFKFVPTGLQPNQVISVTLTPPADVMAELVVARLSDQATLATYKAADVGSDIKVRNLSAPAAPETGYYFIVRSAWVAKGKRTANAKAAYTLEVKAEEGSADLETEPNNDVAHATVIDLAQPKRTGFIAPRGDVDWFTFNAPQPSILRADVTGVDKVKLVLSVIDPAKKNEEKGNEIAKADQGDVKEPQALAGIAIPAGENFIRVEGAWKKVDDKWVRDYENANETYTLTLVVEPDDGSWEREPNDKPDKATTVEVGKDYKGYIQPAKDVDFYRLEVKEPLSVAITVSAVAKLDLGLRVLDANSKDAKGEYALVGSIDKNKLEADERLVVPFEPGSYFIEVKEKGRESNALKPYTLSLK